MNSETSTIRPEHFAQLIRMGRGWAVVRNSATLATTDYEGVGREIVAALNAAKSAERERLREALRHAERALDGDYPWPVRGKFTKSEARETALRSVRAALRGDV